MSQLVNAIQAFYTGERKVVHKKRSKLFQDLVQLESSVYSDVSNLAKVYKIGVKFGNQVMVFEHETLRNPDALKNAVDSTKRSVIEAVFGEFRPLIRQMHDALYDYDVEKARKALIDLEHQMFEVTND